MEDTQSNQKGKVQLEIDSNLEEETKGKEPSMSPNLESIAKPELPTSDQMHFQFLSNKIESDYEESVAELEQPSDYVSVLLGGHKDKASWDAKHSVAFMTNLEKFEESMKLSASKSKFFNSLDIIDQYLLLQENLSLFGNFVLAKYINCDQGTDQLFWIIGLPASDRSKCSF